MIYSLNFGRNDASLLQIVKQPMDLKTMTHKAQTGQYKTLQEMRDDCELMSKNALLFNRAPGEVRQGCACLLVPRF